MSQSLCVLGKQREKLHLEVVLNYDEFGSFIYASYFSGLVLSSLFFPGSPKSWISLHSLISSLGGSEISKHSPCGEPVTRPAGITTRGGSSLAFSTTNCLKAGKTCRVCVIASFQ